MRLFRVEGTPNRSHMQRLKDKTHAQTRNSDAVCLFSAQALVLRLKQGTPERYWINTSVHRRVTVMDLRWTHHMWRYWVGTSVTRYRNGGINTARLASQLELDGTDREKMWKFTSLGHHNWHLCDFWGLDSPSLGPIEAAMLWGGMQDGT